MQGVRAFDTPGLLQAGSVLTAGVAADQISLRSSW